MTEILKVCVRRQDELLERVNKAQINYKKTPKDRLTVTYIETKIEALEKLWDSFLNNHHEMVASIDKPEKCKIGYFSEDMYSEFEKVYESYKIKLRDDLEIHKPTSRVNLSNNQPSTLPTINDLKLPTIHLPKFCSGYENWQTFYDMFVSLIHKNATLTAAQKLHYLKSCLSGEAEILLKNLTTTDINYEEAWNVLVRRYNNRRYNINEIMKTLFSQKNSTSESPTALKNLLDLTSSCLISLQNLQINTSTWDAIIIYMVVSKVDVETRKLWELEVSRVHSDSEADTLPTWEELKRFIESRFRTLEMLESSNNYNSRSAKATPFHSTMRQATSTSTRQRSFHSSVEKKNYICVMCSGQHLLYQCKQFVAQTPEERTKYVQAKHLCFNCLSPNHSVYNCYSSISCRQCTRRHHTLLHYNRNSNRDEKSIAKESSNNENTLTEEINKQPDRQIVAHFTNESQRSKVLLATAMVRIRSSSGYSQIVRALIDQGSEASFITEASAQYLKLKRVSVNGFICGVGEGQTQTKSKASFEIMSLYNPEFSIKVNAFVLKKLTSFIPARDTPIPDWPDISNLPLADPTYSTPGRIDIILGAEIYGEILLDGLLKHSALSGPVAQNTQLGWILSGKIRDELVQEDHNVISMHIHLNEDELLKQFWEIEREPESIKKRKTKEEIRCEEIYEETTYRNSEGRYVVRLPFKGPNPECLNGQSKEIALRRFNSLERKLLKNSKLQEDYRNTMEDYLQQNHMREIIDEKDLRDNYVVYLPHHAVIREDKETTRVRVVFDASSKGVNNVSLNDNLLVGPKLQGDLRHILMRWRFHRICIVADLVKMYRQVVVNEQDTNFQRILWRSNPHEPIQHYKLLRLTFGTSCAPYLAVKSLQQLAKDEQTKYPLAAQIALQDFYMDDLLTGCETIEQAMDIYQQMNDLMRAGGFEIQKWCSNSQELLEHICKEKQRNNQLVHFKSNDNIKVLGITWNKSNDEFQYHFQLPKYDENREDVTKRRVLSEIARIYDPMGWIASIVVRAKIFIQKLWKSKLSWDENLTPQLLHEWQKFKEDLPKLEKIVIPRWLQSSNGDEIELHTFADASQSAYAAAVYLKTTSEDGSIAVNLVTAKTKVAPVEKNISIPRLELCAALLATKLVYEVSQVMNIPKNKIYAWSDSTVVLAWISGEPSRWTTFVSNRTSEILTMLEREQWRHVATDQNPADSASRGLQVTELIKNKLWWHGPNWLHQENYVQNTNNKFETSEEAKTIKALTTTTSIKEKEEFIWTRFSNLAKTLRVLSYCKKFLHLRLPKEQRKVSFKFVSREEAEDILHYCIKETQKLHFQEDINRLRAKQSVSQKSQLLTLHPIIDETGLLRVGGRIQGAQVDYRRRHPVILPSKSHITKLIIEDAHIKTLHGGPQLMLNYLRSKYWILKARNEVKKSYRNCVTCLRYSRQNNNPLMGELPETRLKPMRPFKISGVDFTGFINIRFSPGRGAKCYKGYICLFVCFVTKAIHLEAVSDLTSSGFIAAFQRFVSRRGYCEMLYSDNGTNFIGADRELREMFDSAKSKLPEELQHLLANEGTAWKYSPPHGPNFGGLWEAGVRSTKMHLKRTVGDTSLTFEELTTVLAQIEACLNSRPLSYLSDNADDPMPLTPGHFLVGEPLRIIPDESYEDCNISNLRRWKYCQKMMNDFWRKWSNEYLVTLNQRYKWNKEKKEPEIDDIVLIRDNNIPPAKWWIGRIIEKHSGRDNVTRVVSIKTKSGICKRPCNKLCFLPKSTE